MSIVVSNIVMPFGSSDEEAVAQAVRTARLSPSSVLSGSVHKVSFDLRHGRLSKVYSVELDTDTDEARLVKGLGLPFVRQRAKACLPLPVGTDRLDSPPVVIGFGPAGLFAALILAENGYRPLVLEKGAPIEERDRRVDEFFGGGRLDLSSNVQFGEGGAGTYSDGKLTTRINDPRSQLVLDILYKYGADGDMLRRAKPHIGTDKLKGVVRSIRERIRSLGGTVVFSQPMTDLEIHSGCLAAVIGKDGERYPANVAVLATGHSARDVFELIKSKQLPMKAKPFSVGVRAEHLQSDIDAALYGKYAGKEGLPPGEYVLSRRDGDRACYTFCMCPGGYVVAAASEEGGIVTNGMSYHARSGRNANSAVCVSVSPEDFGSSDVLAGMYFQRSIEQAAFAACGGKNIGPVQLFGDFAEGRVSKGLGRVEPTYPRGYEFVDINNILPEYVCRMIRSSMPYFGRKIRGFDAADTVFTAPETRTSSPVRIERGGDLMMPVVQGLIPCGEGAGYAGGIVSAAVDGIRAAERIMELYAPVEGI